MKKFKPDDLVYDHRMGHDNFRLLYEVTNVGRNNNKYVSCKNVNGGGRIILNHRKMYRKLSNVEKKTFYTLRIFES